MLLDDPSLDQRSPGQELARAHARDGMRACVTLRGSITKRFPLFQHRPRLTVRDLMKVAVVVDDEVAYARETPARPGERPTTRAADAPEADFEPSLVRAPITVIAARAPVPQDLLPDPAALAAHVDYRLLVRLATAENDALLHGPGGDRILGLLQTPGLRRQGPAGSVAATILAAAAACERFGGSADGIVMNPADWWPLLADGAFLGNLDRAGLRINRTRLMPAGTALVGDFQAGATVLDRQTATLRLEEPAPGRVVVVGEFLEGLAVHLPGHFVLTSFT